MFEKVRIKLTIWYVIISISVSLVFSLFIYSTVDAEYRHMERIEETIEQHLEQGFPLPPRILRSRIDPEMIAAARSRLITRLGFVNLIILGVSAIAGYMLAGQSLTPIKTAVDEQKRFISDASHELRTPLTSLRSEMEVGLLNKHITLANAKTLISSNLEEVIELQKLSDNLLELTRYEISNMSLPYQSLSLKTVIEQAIQIVRGLIKKKDMSIHVHIEDVTLIGNQEYLRELFVILLDNAIKYSGPKTNIYIRSKKTDKTAEISVTDEGYGIAAKDLPHIFDRFYRADISRSKNTPGFGLGLSIADKIVAMHKGTINVTSKLNQGTTFTVRFPTSKE